MFQIKKKLSIVLGAILFLAMASSAYAQFTGPSSSVKNSAKKVVTVKEIMQNPVDDQKVLVQGFITQKMDRKYYQFTDGTGDIKVEISPRRFNNQDITEKTKVELFGELDVEHDGSVKIEVKRITILKP